jgi:hypothetical protein
VSTYTFVPRLLFSFSRPCKQGFFHSSLSACTVERKKRGDGERKYMYSRLAVCPLPFLSRLVLIVSLSLRFRRPHSIPQNVLSFIGMSILRMNHRLWKKPCLHGREKEKRRRGTKVYVLTTSCVPFALPSIGPLLQPPLNVIRFRCGPRLITLPNEKGRAKGTEWGRRNRSDKETIRNCGRSPACTVERKKRGDGEREKGRAKGTQLVVSTYTFVPRLLFSFSRPCKQGLRSRERKEETGNESICTHD